MIVTITTSKHFCFTWFNVIRIVRIDQHYISIRKGSDQDGPERFCRIRLDEDEKIMTIEMSDEEV